VKIIVIDTNTFIAAGWRVNANARRVFAAVARRRFRLAVSSAILSEYHGVSKRPRFAGRNYAGLLSWIEKYALLVEPAPLANAGHEMQRITFVLPAPSQRKRSLSCRMTRTCSSSENRLELRS
jgi:predicted nucleic acid-binding protein